MRVRPPGLEAGLSQARFSSLGAAFQRNLETVTLLKRTARLAASIICGCPNDRVICGTPGYKKSPRAAGAGAPREPGWGASIGRVPNQCETVFIAATGATKVRIKASWTELRRCKTHRNIVTTRCF